MPCPRHRAALVPPRPSAGPRAAPRIAALPLAALLLAPLLAGCLAPGTPGQGPGPGGEPWAPSLEAPRFGPPVVVDAGRRGFEPGLAWTPDGVGFVCSPRGAGSGTDVWRTRDGGATWDYVGMRTAALLPPLRSGTGDLGGGDCHLGVDAAGTLAMVDLYAAGASVSTTSDGGDTWAGAPASQLSGLVDRPWVLGGAPGEVLVSGADAQGTGWEGLGQPTPPAGGIWVARSTDGGLTFPQQVLVAGNAGRLGLNSNLAEGAGALFLAFARKVGEGRLEMVVSTSLDRGLTWSERSVAEQAFYPGQCFSPLLVFPVLAADDGGAVHLAWTLVNPATERVDLFLAASPDGGATWLGPWNLADRAGTRLYPWMDSAGPGRVGLAWFESSATRLLVGERDATGLQRCLWEGEPDPVWEVRFALVEGAAAGSPRAAEALVQAAPAHEGDLDRPYAELLTVAFDPAGRAAVAYVADVEGTPRNLVAVEAARGAEPADGDGGGKAPPGHAPGPPSRTSPASRNVRAT